MKRCVWSRGKDNVERRLTPNYEDVLPKDNNKNLYLWIQDGWQTEEKSVIAEAKAKGADNPTLFAFLPAQHKTELSNAIVALEAAVPRSKEGEPIDKKRGVTPNVRWKAVNAPLRKRAGRLAGQTLCRRARVFKPAARKP